MFTLVRFPIVDEAVEFVAGCLLAEADRSGMVILDDVDVIVNVVDAHLAHFEAVGAVWPQADDADLGLNRN